MYKKYVLVLLAAVMSACIFTGCSKTSSVSKNNEACPPDSKVGQVVGNEGGVSKEEKQKFFQAEMQGDIDKVKELLAKNKKLLDIRNDKGGTPLHVATKLGKLEIAKFLVAEGADVNALNDKKRNPLHVAATHNQAELTRFLAASGTELDARSDILSVPLHDAVVTGNVEIVKILVEKGANINATSKTGMTPLTAAMLRDRKDIVDYLLSKGAKFDKRASDPKTKSQVKNEVFCCENL